MIDMKEVLLIIGLAIIIFMNIDYGGRKIYFKRRITVYGVLGGHKWVYGFVRVSWAYVGFLADKKPEGAIEITKKEYMERVK